jgi:hypothetical protein
VKVTFFGDRTDLHWIWDSKIIDRAYPNPDALREQVAALVAASDRRQWEASGPAAWAEESHRAAIAVAYMLPSNGEIDNAYVAKALPVITERLAAASVRLAWVLNDALK